MKIYSGNMRLSFRKNRLTALQKLVRDFSIYFAICAVFFISLLTTGCGKAELAAQRIERRQAGKEDPCLYKAYEPVSIEVIPLTEIKSRDDGGSVIELYLSLRDKYGESIKAPVELRFELYNYIERSGRIKGSRIFMWTDIDITDFEANSSKRQPHLDAYKFTLNLDKDIKRGKYVLHCSCTTAGGKRINKDYVLDY